MQRFTKKHQHTHTSHEVYTRDESYFSGLCISSIKKKVHHLGYSYYFKERGKKEELFSLSHLLYSPRDNRMAQGNMERLGRGKKKKERKKDTNTNPLKPFVIRKTIHCFSCLPRTGEVRGKKNLAIQLLGKTLLWRGWLPTEKCLRKFPGASIASTVLKQLDTPPSGVNPDPFSSVLHCSLAAAISCARPKSCQKTLRLNF